MMPMDRVVGSEPGPLLRWQLSRGDDLATGVVSSALDGRIAFDLMIGRRAQVTEVFTDAELAIAASRARREALEREGWVEI